ncbi:MAG TPA: carboxypeptidase regulatory-like domain-containing protein [Pyrinomonadaceae bacterium]|jgi:hypothetical protein|nr:carboxypeptidase regulatory-like domain-containing protein [Pyrinomonadaceae bacterium]
MKLFRSILIIALFVAVSAGTLLAQGLGSIGGQVTDSLGAVLVGATVTAVAADGKQKQAVTNARGEYNVPGLAPGKYTVKAIAPKFGLYENADVDVAAGEKTDLIVVLTVGGVQENVDVNTGDTISTDPNENKNATVLKDKDLEALPDDPDELAAALQAMAGAAAGPDGGQINIDGFAGGRMPPKEAIREIRINQNPFSAEYDRIGFGRIDILTKPGFDKFRGSADVRFNDESLNSRNPFALNRAPSQTRNFGGYLSGPISAKKSSFFLDFNQSSNDQNAVIGADILTSAGAFGRVDQEVRVPSRRFSISPRIDFAINDKNTLQARYSFSRNTSENQGVGGFTLASRATESTSTQHTVQLTESMIINPKTVNETRFQYDFQDRETNGTTAGPGVNVSGAFFGGGSQIGLNFNRSKRWELQNYTTTSLGKQSQHAIKFGIRIRGVRLEDRSESNYGGTFTFAGFAAPGGDACDLNTDLFVSSLEQYRCKVLGNADPKYNPTQFSLTSGNPIATVSQIDYSPFITDDWKVRQDLTLSFGLRYENQTNLHSNFNLAPRFGFAWSPGAGGAKAPKTVFRGGGGVFYDRFGENQTLRARRQDGVTQIQYLVTNNPAILGQSVFSANGTVTNVPTATQLGTVVPLSSIPYRLAANLEAPYSIQEAVSVERQLDPRTVLSATYTQSRSLHTLRVRNINAPVCPTILVCPVGLTQAQIQARRPDPTQGNVYQAESSGYADTKMLILNFRTTLRAKYTINAGYTLGAANGDTDSLSSPRFVVNTVGFPAYSYDLTNEYGPSAFLPRHSIYLVGSLQLPWGLRANPMIIASTGRRFNITNGVDTNYDSLFFERPTFAQLGTRCNELGLTASFCNVGGVADPNAVIPRNYGKGPGTFITNLSVNKTFGFGGSKPAVASNQGGGGNGRGNRGGGAARGGAPGGGGPTVVAAGGGGGGPMMMMGGGGDARKPYQLTVGVNVQNLFNTVNFSNPVSSLSSPSFGQFRSTGGGFGPFGGGGGSANRRIDLSLRFSF